MNALGYPDGLGGMSIWGKIVGGIGGYAIGGPLGAIVGAVGGHFFDRMREDDTQQKVPEKSLGFTIAVIVLGAKMAKADGTVTRDEIKAFREVFRVPPEELKNVAKVFDIAKKDARGFEPYARQVSGMFHDQPEILEELLWCLSHIAKADGQIHPGELDFLQKVSELFGFDQKTFERVTALQMDGASADPFAILGVSRDASEEDIRKAHRHLVLENHPDKLMAQGLPEEFVALANERLAKINAAYDTIRKMRGIR